MTTGAYIIAAVRTPVAPRNGALSGLQATELGAYVIDAVVRRSPLSHTVIDSVVMGNALYAGGNPARVAALGAGLAESVPAMTIDTQCCAGLDAITIASALIGCGSADAVIAGGMESYSRAPIRQHRPLEKNQSAVEYRRPPFTPWPDRDPDLLDSAADLAKQRGILRSVQEAYAVDSHKKAMRNRCIDTGEIIAVNELPNDSFTRKLSEKICARAPLLGGQSETGLTSTTVAVEADAAACVLIVSESLLKTLAPISHVLEIVNGCNVGSDPTMPSLAPVAAVEKLLAEAQVDPAQIVCAEVMEAFAVQAMVCIDDAGIDPAVVNRGGGALARGHPIGASGAILAVRLWCEMQVQAKGKYGLATIAAAGGLGSALLCRTKQL